MKHPSHLPPFLESLAQGPIVFDGAMGTQLYERGGALNRCFDELSVSQPALVGDVHKDYVDVGADVIQTNTYGANRFALQPHGFAGRAEEICRAAASLARSVAGDRAYVAGSVGPTGLLPKDLIRNRTRRQAFESFRETTKSLVDGGADVLLFETFGYLGELEIAVEAAYGVDVPIIAQASFGDELKTADGATPEEVVERMSALGVDVVGANCVLGPERTLDVMERMIGKGLPLVMQPNAGHPRVVDGRSIYLSSPETFGVVARRAFKLGVSAVGGCCGTSPDHIRRVVASARMLGGGRWKRATDVQVQVHQATPLQEPPIPLAERSRFGAKIARGEFAVSVEVSAPTGLDAAKVLDRIKLLDDGGIDCVNIPDGPRATVRMSNIAMARLMLDRAQRIEPLVHFCARDRNLLGLQGDLLGAHALGIRNTVVITGDPPKVGDYPDATAVFDLDSIGLLGLASRLNRGLDPAGKPIGARTSFVLATGAEPAALDFEREISRLREKREAGAELVMTQPVFDPAVVDRFLQAVKPLGLPVLIGILPLASARNAEFLHQNVPGMRIPEEVRRRMQRAGEGKDAAREGLAIAKEALEAVKDRVQGVYIMPPFGRVELALELLAKI